MEENTIRARRSEATRRKPLRAQLLQRIFRRKSAKECDARARDLTRACASASFVERAVIAAIISLPCFGFSHPLGWSDRDTEALMCIDPIPAYIDGLTKNGKPKLCFSRKYWFTRNADYYVPCGKCLGCQMDKRNRWISRMQLEHFCHDNIGTFITLTYRDPAPSALVKKDVQKFLKKFRNIPRDYGFSIPDFKYFFCGEYGSRFGRPHYHGLLFGVDCFSSDFNTSIVDFKDGHPIFSSAVLAQVWGKGFITCDTITSGNIRYVSKYIMKSTQKRGDEFTLKSIGLGSDFFFDFPALRRTLPMRGCYFDEYEKGILHFPNKYGKMQNLAVPFKAFDRYVELIDPEYLESLKSKRKDFVQNHTKTAEDFRNRLQWLTVMNTEKPNERKLDNES